MSAPGDWENEAVENGRYQVERKLAQGGYGDVYLACDVKLQRNVVLKVPRLSWLEDPQFAERYRREIRAMVNLTHLHTMRVYDIGEHRGRPFAVLEYLAGETLADRLDAHKQQNEGASLSEESLRKWLGQIAGALDYIHRQGYVHRDVKSSNIMFDGNGEAYLTDFGIAKVIADAETTAPGAALTATGNTLGTCEYMAPELCRGETPDGRADQYALAITVYEMLCGDCPIRGATPLATLYQQTSEIPAPLCDKATSVSRQLSDVVARALAKDPQNRYATCGDFAAAVLAVIDQTPSIPQSPIHRAAAPPTARQPTTTPQRRAAPPLPTSGLVTVAPDEKPVQIGRRPPGGSGALSGSASPRPAHDNRWIWAIVCGLLLASVLAAGVLVAALIVIFNQPVDDRSNRQLADRGGQIVDGDDSSGDDSDNHPLGDDAPPITPGPGPPVSPRRQRPGDLIAPFDAGQARAKQQAWARYLGTGGPSETNWLAMEFVLIPPGQYQRGSTEDEILQALRDDSSRTRDRFGSELPLHQVRITQPSYLGAFEVTQRQYEQVMGVNPSYFAASGGGAYVDEGNDTGNKPVEEVSWYDAIDYCNKLSQREPLPEYYSLTVIERRDGSIYKASVTVNGGKGYRLPTDAEWEYACRAGTTSAFHFGSTCNAQQCNVNGLYPHGTTTKGPDLVHTTEGRTYGANAFGLFDMHGNVWEWCHDKFDGSLYQQLFRDPAVDPVVHPDGEGNSRVFRGGSWFDRAWNSRSASRGSWPPFHKNTNSGFRVCRSL